MDAKIQIAGLSFVIGAIFLIYGVTTSIFPQAEPILRLWFRFFVGACALMYGLYVLYSYNADVKRENKETEYER